MEDVVLDVHREHRPGVIHVAVAGEMDEVAVERLRWELQMLRSVLVERIVLDLRRARGVGADTLRVVVAGAEEADGSDQRLVVVREPGTLRDLPADLDVLDAPLSPGPARDNPPWISRSAHEVSTAGYGRSPDG